MGGKRESGEGGNGEEKMTVVWLLLLLFYCSVSVVHQFLFSNKTIYILFQLHCSHLFSAHGVKIFHFCLFTVYSFFHLLSLSLHTFLLGEAFPPWSGILGNIII